MLKTHLPYLFLLLGVFLLFVVLLPKALDTVGQDHLLAFYSQAVEQAGALALAPPEETPGILERDPDGYTGSYQASLSGYTGQLTLFGGTSIEPETEALSLHSQIQGQNGTAQLLYQMGSGAPEILLSDSGGIYGPADCPGWQLLPYATIGGFFRRYFHNRATIGGICYNGGQLAARLRRAISNEEAV